MSIYKPCDIRGHAAKDLAPDLYHRWGLALGRKVKSGSKFIAGGDVRESTPAFLAALVDGLAETGVDVVDLGTLPTPMIYYAKRRLDAAACAIVTASHNPGDVNGLKWMIGDRPPSEADVQRLREAASKRNGAPRGRRRTAPRQLDVTFDYVASLQLSWSDCPPVSRAVVLDPMFGAWACRARRYLQAVFPHSFFTTIHDAPNGAFGGHGPDCSRPELLEELSRAVEHQGAYLGIAFDGDGDRVAFVDDEGNALTAEESTWALLQSFNGELAGQRFVYDAKFSDKVPDAARQLGAEPVVQRSGHAFIRARVLETGALFGAEVSGHYFFRDLAGGDDGLYAACRLISYLARSGRALAELRRQCPPVFTTPDLRVPLPFVEHPAVLDRVRKAWSAYPQREIDGVRIDFPDGWAMVRSSITEPALTFRFEAADWMALNDLVWRFCDSLPDLGDDLWADYHASQGAADG